MNSEGYSVSTRALMCALLVAALPPVASRGQCVGAWYNVSNQGPSPRNGHGLAFDSRRGMVILYGGYPAHADTWGWDGASWNMLDANGPQGARHSYAVSFDPSRSRIVLFGGARTDGTYAEDTWGWDGSTWLQIALAGPSARAACGAAYDTLRDRFVVASGYFGSTTLADTWELDGSAWTQRSTFGLPNLGNAGNLAACFDATRGRTVLFGGTNSNYGLTYEWDGQFWTQTANFGPPDREEPALCFNARRDRTVLVGGKYSFGSSCDTWEYNGTTRLWTQVDASGPAARVSHALAFDMARQAVVMFGGYTEVDGQGIRLGDTWIRTAAPVLTGTPVRRVVCSIGSAAFDVSVSGNGPFAFRWQAFSEAGLWVNLEDGDTAVDGADRPLVSANGTSTSHLSVSRAFPAGVRRAGEVLLRCQVSNSCGTITTNPASLSTCTADINCSGDVSVQDVFDFLAMYFAGLDAANVNGMNDLTIQDIFDFLAAYFQGC